VEKYDDDSDSEDYEDEPFTRIRSLTSATK